VLVVTNLGLIIPSAPAYVGVCHLLAKESLQLFGVDRSDALGYVLVMHAIMYGVFVIGGLAAVWRQRRGLADLRRRAGLSPVPPAL
jgi:glycosyltransferase 2 family protein